MGSKVEKGENRRSNRIRQYNKRADRKVKSNRNRTQKIKVETCCVCLTLTNYGFDKLWPVGAYICLNLWPLLSPRTGGQRETTKHRSRN